MTDNQLFQAELVLVALFCGLLAIVAASHLLERNRPLLRLRKVMLIAFGVRVAAAIAVSSLSVASSLRGGDEATFRDQAQALARWSTISYHSLDVMIHKLHVFVFSLNYQFFGIAPDLMVRIQVISAAVVGSGLLAAAVYELAGARSGMMAAWVLAFEPANVFFSGILHKEPFMMLAEGLVAYSGAVLWKRGRLGVVPLLVLGCLIATATRPYVGWFLAAAAAFITLHASLRHKHQTRSIVLAVVVLGLAVAFIPTVWNASSKKNLQSLQASQDANASDTSANLSLERVDYSTRGKIIVNLPKRVLDMVTKPYPWQVGNISQQLGVLGTLSMGALLFLLVVTLSRNRSALVRRAGPLLYMLFFLTVAYSLSAGNAGTAFRYRTHLVALLICLLCTLRWTGARRTARWPNRPAERPRAAVAGVR